MRRQRTVWTIALLSASLMAGAPAAHAEDGSTWRFTVPADDRGVTVTITAIIESMFGPGKDSTAPATQPIPVLTPTTATTLDTAAPAPAEATTPQAPLVPIHTLTSTPAPTATSAPASTPAPFAPGEPTPGGVSPTQPAPAPRVGDGHPLTGTFTTAHWPGKQVNWIVAMPEGEVHGTILVLHGRGGNAQANYDALHLADQAKATGYALASVDADSTFYYPDADTGIDTRAMLETDFLPLLAREGLPTQKIGCTGWSMGGLGCLLLAEHLGPDRIFATAPMSAAVWEEGHDGVEGEAQRAVRAEARRLEGIPVRIASGTEDSLTPSNRSLAALIPHAETEWTPGGHDDAYWSATITRQLAWMTSLPR